MSSGGKSGNSTERSAHGHRSTPEAKVSLGPFARKKSKGRLFGTAKPSPTNNRVKSGVIKKKWKSIKTGPNDNGNKSETDGGENTDILTQETTEPLNTETIVGSQSETQDISLTNPDVVVEIEKVNSDLKQSETGLPNGNTSDRNGHVTKDMTRKENSFSREKSTLAPPRAPSSAKKDRSDTAEGKGSLARQDSMKQSLDGTSRVSVDAALQTAGVVYPKDEKLQKSVFSNNDSWIRSAIPYLPLWLAITCLVMNILIPGSGTILSGWSILCCGKSRVQAKDDQLTVTLCVNIVVGVAQLFTVTFLFVGWFWSLAWGLKMVSIAVEYRLQKKQQRERELQTLALSAFGSPSHVRSLFSGV